MAKLFARIIWETFVWVGLLGGVLGLVTGLGLIFNSAGVFRFAERMNVWISTRQAMRPFEEPIDIERAVYRSHRVIGSLLIVGALFTLYVLAFRLKGPEFVAVLGQFFSLPVATWIATSLRLFLILANAAAVFIAATMVIRPSALKRVEAWANRQYSGRQATRVWEIPRPGIDPLVAANPKLIGSALTVASLYIVVVIGYMRIVGH